MIPSEPLRVLAQLAMLGRGSSDAREANSGKEAMRQLSVWSQKLRTIDHRRSARQRERPRHRRALVAMLLVAILFACGAPGIMAARLAMVGLDGVRRLQQMQALLTHDGLNTLTNADDLNTLHTQITAARADFAELDRALALGQPIIGISSTLADDARLVRVALHLLNAGDDVLGIAQTVVVPLLSNPFAAQPTATGASTPMPTGTKAPTASSPTAAPAPMPLLNLATFAQVQGSIQRARGEIDAAASLSATIAPGHLPQALGSKISALLARLPAYAQLADAAMPLLNAAPELLGLSAPTNYLILALDRSELRTGGGFIGNFGMLPMSGGRIGKLTLQDTYLLDADFFTKTHQQVPAIYPWWPYRNGSQVYGWGLRDSALAPDFPTDAAAALGIVHGVGHAPHFDGTAPITGVIAITSVAMAQVIAIGGGSLTIPQYPKEVVTPQNLEATIHCFQLGACRNEKPILQPGEAASNDRKRFTAYLGQALLDRVRHFTQPQLKDLFGKVAQDIAAKDIQIAFANTSAEGALIQLHAAAAVPPAVSETFFVTDTNVGGNKANTYVTQHEEDIVTLLPDGGALHHLLIRTTYQRQGPLYEGSTGQIQYWDYRRVYFPQAARFLGITGYLGGPGHGANLDTTSDTAGRAMIGATTVIGDGSAFGQCRAPDSHTPSWLCAPQVRDTFVSWYTPHAWTRDAHGLHYSLLVQRQAGSNVTLTVRLDPTHHDDRAEAASLLAGATRNFDVSSFTSPTGFLAQTDAAWAALAKQSVTLFDGSLAQDEALSWNG